MFKQMLPKLVVGDVFSELFNSGKTIADNLTTLSAIFAVISLIICGLCFFLTRQAADGAKSKAGQIFLGIGLILTATSVVTWLFQTFGGKTPNF